MTQVKPVFPDMFDEVHRTLLVRIDPRRPREEWRRLFEPGWARPEEHVGLALWEGSRLVGFVGLLFAECDVGGRAEPLCNVHSWVVEDEYRGEALTLVLPLRGERRYTLTNLSPEPHVREIFLRLGFEVLEDQLLIMRPPFSLGAFRPPRGFRITADPAAVAGLLEGGEARLHRDHAGLGHHVVLETDLGRCYAVYHVRRRRRLRTALFRHVSDPAVFVESLPGLRSHLLRRHGAVIAECDPRLLEGVEVPHSLRIPREFPRLFKSASLERRSVPGLYSELVLLDLE